MKALENLSKVRRILVWDRKEIGWIEREKVGFFKKKDRILFTSLVGSLFDNEFKSEGELESYLKENNLICQDDTIYKKWSIDLIYSYRCSRTIFFESKTAQNDWLRSHSSNFINIEDGE